ncbi:hypothetical protein BDV95DRAFT_490753 [Massariosphaeria phaeospora]|uniref:Uncharacterized protein n=1 Tax=Massariosphaeria phaeospora TaxID=100035 RepID=A0A7C8M7T2_9PLEO|nr:hypothetical protein BDV95DRAFT_490753 [Massariosphaeria phaeospora]
MPRSTYGHPQPSSPRASCRSRKPRVSYGQPPPSLPRTSRASRRGATKNKASKVPAAFTPRTKKLKVSKRKGPLAQEKRSVTCQLRKNKRCTDDGTDGPCDHCKKTMNKARSFLEICCRDQLEDAILVRRCNGRFNQDEAMFINVDWMPGSCRQTMLFIWNLAGYGPIYSRGPLEVVIREYIPRDGSSNTTRSAWMTDDGKINQVEQPPYAIEDREALVLQIKEYFLSGLHIEALERWVGDRIQHDPIAQLTYAEVARLRHSVPLDDDNLLDLAMQLQWLSVVSQGYGSVWSNNIPGIQEYDYRKMGRSAYEAYNRNSRDKPIPIFIGQQMDVAVLTCLKEIQRLFLKKLKQRVFSAGLKPWYELHLALYVILWNLDYIHTGAERYIVAKTGTMTHSGTNNVVPRQMNKWIESTRVLLCHWRCVLRTFRPFILARENPEELSVRGRLDAEGFQYVMNIVNILDRPGGNGLPVVSESPAHHSMTSEWTRKLFEDAGA